MGEVDHADPAEYEDGIDRRPFHPSDERIESAAEILQSLGETDALVGWAVTFRGDRLECTGVWPQGDTASRLDEIEIPIERTYTDSVDPEGSHRRERERCRLTVRHGLERRELDLRLMREAIASSRREAVTV
jgi:hypothetical protein